MNKSIVYKITCNITGEYYIGSTNKPLYKRKSCHKNKSNKCRSKQIIERGNYNVTIIDHIDAPYTKKEIRVLEQMHIDKNRGDPLLINTNSAYSDVKNDKDYFKNMRKKNPERYKQYDIKRANEKYYCPCGSVLKASCGPSHEKTAAHCRMLNNQDIDQFSIFIDNVNKSYKKKIYIPKMIPINSVYLKDVYIPDNHNETFKSELFCKALEKGRYF